jgi:hypothetical protein
MAKVSENAVKISSFHLNADNPRLIRDAKFKSLVESIKRDPEFLEKRGIVHADGVILGGNQRYMAIKEAMKDDAFRSSLGLSKGEIPAAWVQDASGWPEEKRRRFIIVDNGSWGEWNFDVLANVFDDIPLVDFGISIPKEWQKPKECDSDGTMRKVFDGKKGTDADATDEQSAAPGKYPVTFVLDQVEFDAWEAAKGRMRVRDDKTAFLKMIGGKHA